MGEEYKVSSSSTGLGGGQQPGVGGATSPFEAGSQVTLNDFLEALMSDPGPQCLSWLPVLHRIVAAGTCVAFVVCPRILNHKYKLGRKDTYDRVIGTRS